MEQGSERTYREKIVHLAAPRERDAAGLPWVSRAKNSRPIEKGMVCSEDFGDTVPG